MRTAMMLGVLVMLLYCSTAYAHGGGLDSYGCHHNRKAGGYHFQRKPITRHDNSHLRRYAPMTDRLTRYR